MPKSTEQTVANRWFIYPDSLSGKKFLGYITKEDITQIRGGFVIGQNVVLTDSQNPTTRPGSGLIGEETSGVSPVTRAWVFEKDDGTQIEMRTYGTKVEARVQGVIDSFSLLKDGFTDGLEFAYGVISKTTDTVDYVQFCNGIDDINRWTGSFAQYASDNTTDEITVQGAIDLSDLGFTTSGSIIINGEVITYTGLSGTTFTGCSAVPSSPSSGDIIFQTPVTTGFTAAEKYSVALAHDGRMHVREEAKKSNWNYSKLDDPFDFTTGSLDGDGGSKSMEQGGPITAFGRDEKTIYCFKSRQIKTLQFVQSGDRVDVPVYGTLKPTDDKSTTVGAIGQKSTFHGPNAIYFVTEDKELLELGRQERIDYPQMNSISDPIRPTFQQGVHDQASGIVYNSELYYAYKQDEKSTFNDTVIVFDLIHRKWYLPIVGWNVADWTIINGELHWHSSTSPNSYKVITDRTDSGLPYTSVLRSWSETFGLQHQQKKAGYLFVEILMTENSQVEATVLYDENGASGSETFILDANEDDNYKLTSDFLNTFGASPFGQSRFGSNPDITGSKRYIYFIELKKNIEFFNIAMELSTMNAGVVYELVSFGWFLTEVYKLNPSRFIKGIQ